jgi:hypothetical protein
MTNKRKPPSPQEQLANVYDSLAEDVLAGHIETDDATNQHASRIAREALGKVSSYGKRSVLPPASTSGKAGGKRR